MSKYPEQLLEDAHKYSYANKDSAMKSEICGCFYCFKTFPPTDIEAAGLIPEKKGSNKITVWCPKCGVDSVIGSATGLPVNDIEFLKAMNQKFFNGYSNLIYEE